MAAGNLLSPTLVVAASRHFEVVALVLGGLLVAGALWSAPARSGRIPLPAVFVLAGFVLGSGGVGVLHFNARSGFVADLATVALIVILFRDGLEVEAEMLQAHWHLPLRKLVLAMPITAAVVAVAAHVLVGLSLTESFLLGALLAPTDPVLSSSVVTNPRVPRLVRHSLNLESGLNDGLALPAVLALAAALTVGSGHFVWWRFLAEDLVIGFAVGLVLGFAAAWVMPREHGLADGIPPHEKALYALGAAFATYGVAVLAQGNGLIAVYVAAITLGIRRADLGAHFARQLPDLVEIVKLGIFAVFGSLLTLHGLFSDGWAAIGVVAVALLVARPVGVFAALLRTPTDLATRSFMAWFGPKGVATMTFSLLVLNDRIESGTRIFNLAALATFASIVLHGVSDGPGASWIGAHSEHQADAAEATDDSTPIRRRAVLSGVRRSGSGRP